MADRPDDETSDRGSPPGMPRWVRVFAVVTLALILLVVLAMLLGGGHGPGRHLPSGADGIHTPPSSAAVAVQRR